MIIKEKRLVKNRINLCHGNVRRASAKKFCVACHAVYEAKDKKCSCQKSFMLSRFLLK